MLLLPRAKYILPPEMKFVSAFSAFLFLFEAISKNLPRTHINLHCLILICLETLLSIFSLHSHTDVLLYWYLSEPRPIIQTVLKTVACTQRSLKFIGHITSMKMILLLIVYCFRMYGSRDFPCSLEQNVCCLW